MTTRAPAVLKNIIFASVIEPKIAILLTAMTAIISSVLLAITLTMLIAYERGGGAELWDQ